MKVLGGGCPICAAYRAGGPAVLHGCTGPLEEAPRRDPMFALRSQAERDGELTNAMNRLATAMDRLATALVSRSEATPS